MEWKQLLKEKPKRYDIYKCLVLEYPKRWYVKHLVWTSNGFQSLDYGKYGTYELDIDVAYWYDVEYSEPPFEDANKLIFEIQFFFGYDDLFKYLAENKVLVHSKGVNCANVVLTNIDENILKELRSMFKYNPPIYKVLK